MNKEEEKDPRQWAKKPATLRTTRNKEELRTLYKRIREGLAEHSTETEADILSELLTLCNSIRGTELLKEHVRDLLMAGTLTGFPIGIFDSCVAKEYERNQILIYQRMAIRIALKLGEKKKARQLYRRQQRWKEQFEKLYEEPASTGCSKKELVRHLRLSGLPKKETKGSSL